MMTVVMMMVVRFSSHVYNRCRYCQYGRVLVPDELANTLDDEIEKQGKPEYDEQVHSHLSSQNALSASRTCEALRV